MRRASSNAVPIDRIRHKAIPRIAHGERPERIVRRELSCWKVHDVIALAGELLTCAIYCRSPVHRLLRYVDWARKCLGASGSVQGTVAGVATSVHGGPAADLRNIGVRDDLERDERQHAAADAVRMAAQNWATTLRSEKMETTCRK
jgi:hypothetical protein